MTIDVMPSTAVSDTPWVTEVESVQCLDEGFLAVINVEVTLDGTVHRQRTLSLVTVDATHITRLCHWCTGTLRP
jgi:hypothetical protein